MGAAAPIAIGLTAASQLFGAVTEADQLSASARVDDENARRTLLEGALSAKEAARTGRAVQGEAIAALGAGGAAIGSQFAGDAIFANALAIEKDILNRRYAAGTEAEALRASARSKRKQRPGVLFGGLLRAGASALTGISDMENASALRAANERVRNARLPGGQRLPMPPGFGG